MPTTFTVILIPIGISSVLIGNWTKVHHRSNILIELGLLTINLLSSVLGPRWTYEITNIMLIDVKDNCRFFATYYTAFCDHYGKTVYQLIVIIMKLFSLCCHCSYATLTFDLWTQFLMKKKRSEETQTLRAGCSKADPEIFLPGGAVKI